jgi:hypothetical protein
MFCSSSPTGPCRCGCQQSGKWREEIVCACRVSSSMKACSMCPTSAQLHQAFSSARRRPRKGCAGASAPVYRIGRGAVQNVLSSPTSLALRIFSFVLRPAWSDKSSFLKVKITFRVKYLVPENFGRTPHYVRKLRLRSIVCSDMGGIRL